MHGLVNHTSPNDLMMELKDGIGACNSHAKSLNIVMPLLYAGFHLAAGLLVRI